MKAMMKWGRAHRGAALVAGCYLLAALALLLWHLYGFVYNRALHARGDLPTAVLGIEDFEMNADLVLLEDGRLVSVGADPQLTARDGALRADSILVEFEAEAEPGMVSAYWAKSAGGDHSIRRIAYARQAAGGYLMLLPAQGGVHLRIDPAVDTNVFTNLRVTLNPPRSFASFFVPGAGELVLAAVLPALLAGALVALGRARTARGRLRAGKGGAAG